MSEQPGSKISARAWNGVMLMAGAALLSKLIGVLQKIPLQNIAGDRVFGIYNAVYPFYQMAVVLATAGLPTAVSIVIAQRLRDGQSAEEVRFTLKAALLLLGLTGVIACGWMWAGAEQAAQWIGDSATIRAIRSLSAALLLVPFVAALRGYKQGIDRMAASAASQVLEQLVRVAVMVLVLALGLTAGWTDEAIAAGVMGGSAAGAAAALLLLGMSSWRERVRSKVKPARVALAQEMKRLAVLALPVALGAVVVPVIGVVDAFTVPRLLGSATEAEAMSLFGIYSRGQPLVQLVVMVAGAAAAALVPGLVLAKARQNMAALRLQLSVVLRLTWAIGAAAAIGLVLLAQPLNVMLYADASGTTAFALIGCTALAGCANAVTAPLLQALGAVRAPVALLLMAALIKGALNAALVPSYGIEGAAVAGIAALTAAALLGAAAVRRLWRSAAPEMDASAAAAKGGRAALSAAARTVFALAVMAAAVVVAEQALSAMLGEALPPRAAAAARALTGVAVGACAFGAAALRSGVIRAREWRALPGGGEWAARLRRWRLVPPAERE